MLTLKDTEVSLSYVQCFLCLVFSSVNVSMFYNTWLDSFWTDLHIMCGIGVKSSYKGWTSLFSIVSEGMFRNMQRSDKAVDFSTIERKISSW